MLFAALLRRLGRGQKTGFWLLIWAGCFPLVGWGQPSAGPVVSASPGSLALGKVNLNTAGALQTYQVSGSSLGTTGGITITPPPGVEISSDGFMTSANSSASSLVVPASSGAVASTTISVRLAAAATAGTISGAISNVSGSGSQDVAVSGTVVPVASTCLSEGFEGATVPPAGWVGVGVSKGTVANSGTGAIEIGLTSATGSLTTPRVANPQSLSFALTRTTNATPRTLTVSVSTTSQTSGFTALATYDLTNTTTAYQLFTLDLSAYNGSSTVWLQFAKTGTNNSPWRIDDVGVTCGAVAPAFALSMGPLASAGPYCVGQSRPVPITVPFVVSGGSFGTGNVFTAYLSKDNFTTKTSIGTLTAVESGSISASIPAGTATANYRIRVEASSPAVTTADNGADLPVVGYQTNNIANYAGTGDNGRVTLTWTNPTSCFGQVLIVAKAGSIPSAAPSSAATYVASSTFGAGTELPAGSRQFVVYQGAGTSATITGLTNGTAYYFKAFVTNGDGYSTGSERPVTPVVPATLTEVIMPQYISGHAVGVNKHAERLPYAFRVTIGGLAANTTYKYYNSAVSANAANPDAAGFSGVGNPIYPKSSGFVRSTNSSIGAGSTLTTDAGGSYTGWFVLEPTASEQFEAGDLVKMRIILNNGTTSSAEVYFVTTASTVSVRQLGTTAGSATQASGLYGNSFGAPMNFVLTYDNLAGVGRPLTATFIESDGSANTTSASYASFYATNVEGKAGAYGLLTPNDNANGVQRLEQRSLTDASLVGCPATDDDGLWPGTGARTRNPDSGATALVLTTDDTPFRPVTVTGFSPAGAPEGATVTVTGTNFRGGTQPMVSFGEGPAVAALTVDATGASLTVAVPAGATSGPISVAAGCGAAAISANNFTVAAPLPVELVGFTAARQLNGVQVQWTTAAEQNAAFFEVQRSYDGRTFTPVAKVAALGSSAQRSHYAHLDRNAPAGQLYYRLRQVDADGKISFSTVRQVGVGALDFSIFPNPARTVISFYTPPAASTMYRIFNQLGQVMRKGQAPAGIASVDVASLPAGIYALELQTAGGPVMHRFEKE